MLLITSESFPIQEGFVQLVSTLAPTLTGPALAKMHATNNTAEQSGADRPGL